MANLITVLPVTLEQQLEALKGSIAKWQGIVDGTVQERGVDNCPCCQAFYRPADYDPLNGCSKQACCRYCPVAARTQKPQCMGTPYQEYHEASNTSSKSAKKVAKYEVAFLQHTYDWLAQQTEPVYAVYPEYDTVEQPK